MRLLILLTVFLAMTGAATEVYRWVDADGQVHYSDQWQPGAERVRITTTPGFSAPRPAEIGEGEQTAPPVATGSPYRLLDIASPAQEEVLWNIEGQLRVSLQLQPALQPGHELRLYLDGQEQDIPPGSTSMQLSEVFRGVHTLRAEVVDEQGAVLITSPTRTFAVRQTSIANPQRPNIP